MHKKCKCQDCETARQCGNLQIYVKRMKSSALLLAHNRITALQFIG